MSKSQRNKPCPCGSNLKYKKCCGGLEAPPLDMSAEEFDELIAELVAGNPLMRIVDEAEARRRIKNWQLAILSRVAR